jgi:hypothetical protein
VTELSETPVVDQAFNGLSETEKTEVAERDDERLAFERRGKAPNVAAKMTAPVHSVGNMLREWERLVNAMESDWSAVDYFLVDDYVHALEVRHLLDETFKSVPDGFHSLREALAALDRRFIAQTIQQGDGGGAGELEPWVRAHAARAPEWLWNRRPRVLPW